MVDTLEFLLDTYGLEYLLRDNDIEDITVLECLVEYGLIDLQSYWHMKGVEDDY